MQEVKQKQDAQPVKKNDTMGQMKLEQHLPTQLQKQAKNKEDLDRFLKQFDTDKNNETLKSENNQENGLVQNKKPTSMKKESQQLQNQATKFKSKLYQSDPIFLSFRSIYRNMENLNKYILYKIQVKPQLEDKPGHVEKLATPEELYVIYDIYHDYQRYTTKMQAATLLLYLVGMGNLGKTMIKSPLPWQIQVGVMGLAFCLIDIQKVASFVAAPRINYYLRLMQLGEDYKLGYDTVQYLNFLQQQPKTASKHNQHSQNLDNFPSVPQTNSNPQLSKELQRVHNTSLNILLRYNQDQFFEYGYDQKEKEDLEKKKGLLSIVSKILPSTNMSGQIDSQNSQDKSKQRADSNWRQKEESLNDKISKYQNMFPDITQMSEDELKEYQLKQKLSKFKTPDSEILGYTRFMKKWSNESDRYDISGIKSLSNSDLSNQKDYEELYKFLLEKQLLSNQSRF
eukprot:403376609